VSVKEVLYRNVLRFRWNNSNKV